jgi:hypothetical protein
MCVQPAPKVVIQNKLAKCRNKLQELGPLINTKGMCLSLSYARPKHAGIFMSFVQSRKLTNIPNLSPQVTDHSEILMTLQM